MHLPDPFQIGDCLIDPALNLIQGPCSTTTVQPRIMRVLVRLAQDAGRPVSRQALLDAGWEGAPYVADEALTRAVSTLRAALHDCAGNRQVIRTVPKLGYMLAVSVSEISSTQNREPRRPARQRRPFALQVALALVVIIVSGIGLQATGVSPVQARVQIQERHVIPVDSLSAMTRDEPVMAMRVVKRRLAAD